MADPYASFSKPRQADPYAGIATRQEVQGGVQDWEPEGYTGGQKVARAVGLGAQGFNDSIANTVGAPVDAAAWLMRQAGVPATAPVGGSASIKRGLDFVASIPGKIGLTSPDAPTRLEPTNTTERTAYGVGEGVGNALSIVAPAGAIANTARAGTVTQGVANALASQPVAQAIGGAVGGGVTAATGNPWYGLIAGAGVPLAASVGRGLVSPATNRNTPQQGRLVAAAGAEGIPLTPAQTTGSRGMQGLEGVLATTPGPSGPTHRFLQGQREQFNRAVLDRAGVTATDASPDTLQRAFQNIGQTFDDLATRTTLNIDPRFAADVQRVAADYGRRLETNVAPVFQSYLDDLAPLVQAAVTPGAGSQVAGDVYARIYTGLNTTARTARDPALRRALNGLVDAFDDALERSTSGALRQEWQTARREYQALMTVDRAMQGGTQADRAAGNIPFNALRQAVVSSDRPGFSRGRGQLNELSRIGDLIGQRLPSSGTSEREAVLNLLKWPVMGGMNVLARGYFSGPGRAYLTNQLAGTTDFGGQYLGLLARQGLEEATQGENALLRGGR